MKEDRDFGQKARVKRFGYVAFAAFFILSLWLTSSPAKAYDQHGGWFKACSQTATAAFKACQGEITDDYWIAFGNCTNLTDYGERKDCLKEAGIEFNDGRELCNDQREARLELCEELGESPYDPRIKPDKFVDFEEVVKGGDFTSNPYFPLVPGTVWNYRTYDGDGTLIEKIKVEVLKETKEILGVNCIVVRDRVWEIDEEGEKSLVEDTDDWYAQDLKGNVWYFGEIAQDFEDGELVSIDGSWKAGRDYAKPGYLMLINPQAGDLYRQEFALGEAEDVAEVISRNEESVTVPYGNYKDDVVKTKDGTPIEPDVYEFKYYAPDVGLILEVNPETGERVELVGMTPGP